MYFLNTYGLVGVVLTIVVGVALGSRVPATPGLEGVAMWGGALFLGLYGLTVDRCEVPGVVASYRANLQNFFAAVSEAGMGSYDKPVVPGRRMAFFFLPVFLAPLLLFLVNLLDIARVISENGRLLPADRFQFVDVPVAAVGVWVAYAWITQPLRKRVKKTTRESVHAH